ncbi:MULTISPECIES: FxsA family protein [unclassified Pseudomonas]|uniref:FxsA family protein n=1 Tax=unclassified Pseudomonas TaxID=196821 RepID=UPI002447AFE6|nr:MULTISPECIES: FxsA family protein [unclassified Pseudomonas]MDG9922022.1 membrane protein FxsA [Pseudomonas sp. GD04045]MDH0033885.1 membrane protein FxsA [Pseudomonas sp. GD04019]
MRAFLFLLLLFPIIELAVLIQVGSAIGVLPTLLLVIGTAVLGSVLLRVAGVATAWRARERLARGEMPEQEMFEGLLIAVGGGLLLLPGFISDAIGLLCLIPFTRRLMIGRLQRRAQEQALRQRAFFDDAQARSGQTHPQVIEGEYQRRDCRRLCKKIHSRP